MRPQADSNTHTHTYTHGDCMCVPERKSGFKDLLHTQRENTKEKEGVS